MTRLHRPVRGGWSSRWPTVGVGLWLVLAAIGCQADDRTPEAVPLRFASTWKAFGNDTVTRLNAQPGPRLVYNEPKDTTDVVTALQTGAADLGTATASVVYLAYRDGMDGHETPHTSLRGLAILWPSHLYVSVAADSPARSVADLRGKRVAIPHRGSTGAAMAEILLTAYGMSYEDIVPAFQTGYGSLGAVERGEVDGYIWSYPPVPSILRSDMTRVLSLSQEVSLQMRSAYPFLSRVVVPARNGRAAVHTVSSDVLLVCRATLSEAVVYELVKTFFRVLPDLASLHPEAALIDPRAASATPIPLHPGAARYYREREIVE